MPVAPTVPLHRAESPVPGPPRLVELPNGTPVWLVTRYDDVHQVLTDPRFGRSPIHEPGTSPVADSPSLLDSREAIGQQDGDAHLRLRRAVGRAFTPRSVEHMRPWVTAVVDGLLDGLVEKGSPADLVTDYALPLPCTVIHRLLAVDDVPIERLLHWAEHAFAESAAAREEGDRARCELTAFTAELITERRGAPGDDVVSSIVQAADGEGGIPEAALVNLIATMIVGGHDTTMTMLSNSLVYLLTEQPAAWARLAGDEQGAAVLTERLLHLIPLNDHEERPGRLLAATEDIRLGGMTIRSGEFVATDRVAANRDPEAFPGNPHADLFSPLPRPSLVFGAGRHYCLGTWLARAELQLALHRLAARLPALRLTLTADDIVWRRGTVSRSPLHLPAAW
ncbi:MULTISPECIES: cytochrome P450 [unclassified Streptomyces]|uniref:cytochrome P450 n=1 Tax=unclassified Streptomyces TaxID=2593676 RepID=UPI00331C48AD